jgi:ribosomal protein L40E
MARKRRSRPQAPEVCPVCGADVHPNALACRECGADHNSGWREDAGAEDGLDLPDEEFNYEEFTRREFGNPAKPAGLKTIWWVVAIALGIILIFVFLGSGRH